MSELQRYLDFALQTAHEAGQLTVGYFRRSLEIIDKADGSPVTIADREAEKLIRAAIEKTFPDHGIYGEEFGTKDPTPGCSYTWFIDPIDGTKSFIHGVPLYTTLLALVREEESVVGIINIPAEGQMMSAAKGMGCRLNGVSVRVSQVSDPARAIWLTSDQYKMEEVSPRGAWRDLYSKVRFTRTWGDAYGYMMVASGRAEFMVDPIVSPYDVAPLPVILREAGGRFFDWKGRETIFGGNGAAANAALAPALEQALARS